MKAMTNTLSSTVLAHPVAGRNLAGATLASALGREPVALVFLRHFG